MTPILEVTADKRSTNWLAKRWEDPSKSHTIIDCCLTQLCTVGYNTLTGTHCWYWCCCYDYHHQNHHHHRSRRGSVGVVPRLWVGHLGAPFLTGSKTLFLLQKDRNFYGHIQVYTKSAPEAHSTGVKWGGAEITTAPTCFYQVVLDSCDVLTWLLVAILNNTTSVCLFVCLFDCTLAAGQQPLCLLRKITVHYRIHKISHFLS
jgi:hypothetical protein